MSNYVKATNFYAKDALLTGDPTKIIKGSEIDDEYNAIATAIGTKADLNSPIFTGVPTAPTAASGTNTTQVATTRFVQEATGTIAIQDADNVAITGGVITGITDLSVEDGGTGASTLDGVVIGNGTSAMTAVAPSTSGNVLTSNGTTWQSTAPAPTLGVGQTWQNVTSSRSAGVNYTNSTGKPIQVSISIYRIGSVGYAYAYVGGVQVAQVRNVGTNDVGTTSQISFIVPDGSTYSVSASFEYWAELR
jgi:hypothetical protein